MKLFVYGTLKRGHGGAAALADQHFVGEARTQPDYRMYDCVAYPALVAVEPGSGQAIEGELWDVDERCLRRIDEVEGVHVGLYERGPVRLAEPADEEAETYFFAGSVAGLAECGPRW